MEGDGTGAPYGRGMKKYIREILDDFHRKRELEAEARKPVPEDLNNQELSKDPLQRTRQREFQEQKREERS